MNYRIGSREDLETVIQLFHESVHRVAARDYTPAQLAAWAPTVVDKTKWSAKLHTQTLWIAEENGMAVGFATLAKPDHLDMLYVHPSYLRRGIGSGLLQKAEEFAQRVRARQLNTEASLTARRFFESRGYKTVKEQSVSRAGQTLTNFRMEKKF